MIQRIYSLENELSTQLHPPQVLEKILDMLLRTLQMKNPYIFADDNTAQRTFFRNGSCIYLDSGTHLEYSLPECGNVYTATACDRASMHIIESASIQLEYELKSHRYIEKNSALFIFKNNTAKSREDEKEVTYGTHENYSINAKELQTAVCAEKTERFARLQKNKKLNMFNPVIYVGALLVPFLVSRQIICGAGSVIDSRYEISQRSRFFKNETSEAATKDRGIANLKNEHHANGYYRVHVICGDANMSEYSTYLKLGITGIILRMIEENAFDPFMLLLPESVDVLKKISKDTSLKRTYQAVCRGEVKQMSAIDMQQLFLDNSIDFVEKNGGDDETEKILKMWQYVLDALRSEPEKLFGKVDWITKKMYLERFASKKNLPDNHPQIANADLMYHALNKSRGLYYSLEAKHPDWKIVSDDDVKKFITTPPPTRATARVKTADAIVQKKETIYGVDWSTIESEGIKYKLMNPFSQEVHPRLTNYL